LKSRYSAISTASSSFKGNAERLAFPSSVAPIFLPPSRERKSDIAPLANKFLGQFNAEQGIHLTFSQSSIDFLTEYDFPGNIRELENYVLRTATFANGDVVVEDDFFCLNDDNLSVLWNGSHAPPFTRSNFIPRPKAQHEMRPRRRGSDAPKRNFDCSRSLSEPSWHGKFRSRSIVAAGKDHQCDGAVGLGESESCAASRFNRQIGYALIKYNIAVKRL